MSDKPTRPTPVEVPAPETPPPETPVTIAKPAKFSLDKFKSNQVATLTGVETRFPMLPHYKIGDAKDLVRLHPNEAAYWSGELCFVNVPVKGQKNASLHLILEALAMYYLPAARILRFRLALASKPYDVFFLCEVPSRNLDNIWVATALQACEQAKKIWTADSRGAH